MAQYAMRNCASFTQNSESNLCVIASLPCYLEENVDWQRGKGSYNASMEGLRRLNDVGYGTDPRLRLNLVYNPNGPHLPPAQEGLEGDYKRELKDRYGIAFKCLIGLPSAIACAAAIMALASIP